MSSFPGLEPGLISHGSVLAFLGTAFVCAVSGLILLIALLHARKRLAVFSVVVGLGTAGLYGATLVAFSLLSPERSLARGQEKYFCEPDCHIAYSIVDAGWARGGDASVPASDKERIVLVTLRVRFDENTIAPWRPRDATLIPEARHVALVDAAGKEYPPSVRAARVLGTSVDLEPRPLVPGEQYRVVLAFDVATRSSGLRLMIRDVSWDHRLTIGDEGSWLHLKTYMKL